MNMANRSDNFQFNEPQLAAQISILNDICSSLRTYKTKLDDYITNVLVNDWTSEGGKLAITDLKNFSAIDFEDTINYLDHRIKDLENILEYVKDLNVR